MDTILDESAGFNPAPPTVMHVDLNSCFASIEQQANPRLRGRPVVVAAYTTAGGCVLAASREAKLLHIETGMRVGEARALCPSAAVLSPDPWKYRYVNRKLLAILRRYTQDVEIKSIDEMVMDFRHAPEFAMPNAECRMINEKVTAGMIRNATDIKQRIRNEIGQWLTVSVGIAPNRYLAKIGAGLRKPDGLDVIEAANIESVLSGMKLEKLTGIKNGYGGRLRRYGIDSAVGFYRAPIKLLKTAFRSVIGYHWWLRFHGWEADDRDFGRRSYGQSYALYTPYAPSDVRLKQILCQLTEKMARRMRRDGYQAAGIHVSCLFSDYSYWHKSRKLTHALYAGGDLYEEALTIVACAPDRPVRILAVSCHYLSDTHYEQGELFADNTRKRALVSAIDAIQDRWGEFTIHPGRMMNMEHKVLDRIAFGGVKGLEEIVFREPVEYKSES